MGFRMHEPHGARVFEAAAKNGKRLSAAELNAPLSDAEINQANTAVKDKTGRGNFTGGEVNDRLRSIQQQQKEPPLEKKK